MMRNTEETALLSVIKGPNSKELDKMAQVMLKKNHTESAFSDPGVTTVYQEILRGYFTPEIIAKSLPTIANSQKFEDFERLAMCVVKMYETMDAVLESLRHKHRTKETEIFQRLTKNILNKVTESLNEKFYYKTSIHKLLDDIFYELENTVAMQESMRPSLEGQELEKSYALKRADFEKSMVNRKTIDCGISRFSDITGLGVSRLITKITTSDLIVFDNFNYESNLREMIKRSMQRTDCVNDKYVFFYLNDKRRVKHFDFFKIILIEVGKEMTMKKTEIVHFEDLPSQLDRQQVMSREFYIEENTNSSLKIDPSFVNSMEVIFEDDVAIYNIQSKLLLTIYQIIYKQFVVDRLRTDFLKQSQYDVPKVTITVENLYDFLNFLKSGRIGMSTYDPSQMKMMESGYSRPGGMLSAVRVNNYVAPLEDGNNRYDIHQSLLDTYGGVSRHIDGSQANFDRNGWQDASRQSKVGPYASNLPQSFLASVLDANKRKINVADEEKRRRDTNDFLNKDNFAKSQHIDHSDYENLRQERMEKLQAERQEKERRAREAVEERERERQRLADLAKEKAEKERLEREARMEKDRQERELKTKALEEERAKRDAERLEKEKKAREEQEARDKKAREERAAKEEQDRIKREAWEKEEREKKEAREKKLREQAEKDKKEREARELAAKEQAEKDRKEREAKEKAAKEQSEKERREREERDRLAKEQADKERQEREARDKADRQRLEGEAREREARANQEREERDRLANEKKERDRIEKEEKERLERERLDRQRLEREEKEREERRLREEEEERKRQEEEEKRDRARKQKLLEEERERKEKEEQQRREREKDEEERRRKDEEERRRKDEEERERKRLEKEAEAARQEEERKRKEQENNKNKEDEIIDEFDDNFDDFGDDFDDEFGGSIEKKESVKKQQKPPSPKPEPVIPASKPAPVAKKNQPADEEFDFGDDDFDDDFLNDDLEESKKSKKPEPSKKEEPAPVEEKPSTTSSFGGGLRGLKKIADENRQIQNNSRQEKAVPSENPLGHERILKSVHMQLIDEYIKATSPMDENQVQDMLAMMPLDSQIISLVFNEFMRSQTVFMLDYQDTNAFLSVWDSILQDNGMLDMLKITQLGAMIKQLLEGTFENEPFDKIRYFFCPFIEIESVQQEAITLAIVDLKNKQVFFVSLNPENTEESIRMNPNFHMIANILAKALSIAMNGDDTIDIPSSNLYAADLQPGFYQFLIESCEGHPEQEEDGEGASMGYPYMRFMVLSYMMLYEPAGDRLDFDGFKKSLALEEFDLDNATRFVSTLNSIRDSRALKMQLQQNPEFGEALAQTVDALKAQKNFEVVPKLAEAITPLTDMSAALQADLDELNSLRDSYDKVFAVIEYMANDTGEDRVIYYLALQKDAPDVVLYLNVNKQEVNKQLLEAIKLSLTKAAGVAPSIFYHHSRHDFTTDSCDMTCHIWPILVFEIGLSPEDALRCMMYNEFSYVNEIMALLEPDLEGGEEAINPNHREIGAEDSDERGLIDDPNGDEGDDGFGDDDFDFDDVDNPPPKQTSTGNNKRPTSALPNVGKASAAATKPKESNFDYEFDADDDFGAPVDNDAGGNDFDDFDDLDF